MKHRRGIDLVPSSEDRYSSPYLSTRKGQKLNLACEPCQLKKRYDVDGLLARIGDICLPDLPGQIAKALNCPKAANQYSDRCGLTFVREPLEATPARRSDPTFADLREWHVLLAQCGGCKSQHPIDRLALERRFGVDKPLSTLKPSLVCKQCGNRSANKLLIGKLAR